MSRDLEQLDLESNTLAERSASLEGRLSTKTDEDMVGVSALLGADPDDIYETLRKLNRPDLQMSTM